MTREPLVAAILSGTLLDEEATISLGELCRACGLHAEQVMAMVEEGLIAPRGVSPTQWRFPTSDLTRLHTALRLQQDLQLNLAGVALAMDLLEEVRGLRARVRVLEYQLFEK